HARQSGADPVPALGQGAAAGYRRLGRSECRDRRRGRHQTDKAAYRDGPQARRGQNATSARDPELARHKMMLKKRSFSLSGHRTSVALEPEFWAVIEQGAQRDGKALAALVAQIDASRGERPLASALRLYALALKQ